MVIVFFSWLLFNSFDNHCSGVHMCVIPTATSGAFWLLQKNALQSVRIQPVGEVYC